MPRHLLLLLSLVVLNAAAQAQPVVRTVLNAADTSPALCPGVAATILGTGLGPAQTTQTTVAGLSVTVGGKAAFVIFSSATQLAVQLPVDAVVGQTTLIVQYQGQSSTPFTVQISEVAPAFFTATIGGATLVTAVRPDFSLVSVQNPLYPGDLAEIFATGLGATTPQVPTGVTGVGTTANKVTVTVSGVSAQVLFSGLTSPAEYQVSIIIPAGLSPGLHPITVTVAGVTSAPAQLPTAIAGLAVSQTGFTFQAVQGGGTPSPTTLRILNGSSLTANYTVTASTVSGGSGWLSVTPSSGAVAPGQNAPISVSVNPGSLAPGDYYGSITVDAPGVPNAPQFVSVVLNVSGPTVNPGPVVDPTGLVFVSVLGGTAPSAQSVRITDLTNRPSPFTVTGTVLGNQNWFTFSPANGTVAPNQPATVSVTPNITGLAAGVYRGALVMQFPQDNTARSIDLLLVVTPVVNPSAAAPLEVSGSPAGPACKPTALLPVFRSLGSNFSTSVGWPANIEVRVVDDCGSPLKAGTVTATFSNNDPALSLISNSDGNWTGTWAAVNPRTSSLTVTATAVATDASLHGTAQVGGAAQANPNVPIVAANGMVSAGSYSTTALPSPGELVAVFGLQMADGAESASALPLKTAMQGATLTMSGRPLPLVFTSAGQINAQVPYDLPPGTTVQLVAQHGARLSVPQPVTIGGAEPAIFSTDLTGKGQGHIYVIPGPGVQVLANASAPAKAGDVLQIYCTGLGPVAPAATAGSATPSDALRNTVTAVTLTIGGVNAPVAFAGLTPGFTGLYQINATVPAGVSAGQVPVVVTVGAFSGPTVTMAIK